ncbi:DUF924 family protein [Neptunicoccus cionae]|uniref:DUF924 domain-containing protein n=1 Tax=Neptunicoccus cionae TaxID=2035344 RepID=A0A916VNI1_9RHOB|nr:DUF924 family protein [Amylibacter cionae]GGA10805.1 hypothetical protein GCM10011498_08680 [Amylibacter cionae]
MDKAKEIIEFWINEVGPSGWYQSTKALDNKIKDRFMDDYEAAKKGDYDGWGSCPDKSLALLILLDQFPRNMFREDPRAFATDAKALKVAAHAIDEGYDMRTDEPQRQFYYLPFMHSECLTHQERCVRLIAKRMSANGSTNLLHAKVHRAVIRKFGRFPYRNNALGRNSTQGEVAFLENGGYQQMTQDVKAAA